MGSAESTPRKPKQRLPKVPKYEEPNALPMPGFGSPNNFGQRFGRYGHSSDGREHHRPGLLGRIFLKMLGMRRHDADAYLPATQEHEPEKKSEEVGTVPRLPT